MLPIPPHFDGKKVGSVWRVPYQERATEAEVWAKERDISPSSTDKTRICLLIIDAQNTFCIPEFELFVGGRSGAGAVEDNLRLCEFIYKNLGVITAIAPTMDTHTAMQIFHPIFWINDSGEHPPIASPIAFEEVEKGRWKVNPAVADSIAGGDRELLQQHALYYAGKLTEDGKYPLTVWPYHSMLGGIGHALVSALEEAVFFHSIARSSQTMFEMKGDNPLTENYSVLRPEVLDSYDGRQIGIPNQDLIEKLLAFDAVIIAGQAKSHCVAWTVEDLLQFCLERDPSLTRKIYLLEDCTSAVVVPGVVDFTEPADAAFRRFAEAGMHLVKSTEAIANWIDLHN